MTPFWLGWLFIAGFFALEIVAREGSGGKSLESGAEDRGTTLWLGTSYGVAMLTLWRGRAVHPGARAWSGAVLLAQG